MKRFACKFMGMDVKGVMYADGSAHMHCHEDETKLDLLMSNDLFVGLSEDKDVTFVWID